MISLASYHCCGICAGAGANLYRNQIHSIFIIENRSIIVVVESSVFRDNVLYKAYSVPITILTCQYFNMCNLRDHYEYILEF